jgi:hypothetical protein
MSAPLMPPLLGGSRTFSVTTWNIWCTQRAGLAAAANGLCQMWIRCCNLTEMKLNNNQYPRIVLGYWVILSKLASLQ